MKLLYQGEKPLSFTLTKNPIKNPRQSPRPLGYTLEELDPADVQYEVKKQALLNHPNYCENETITLKPGVNEIENDEQAEYLYKILGNPEDGGEVPVGVNKTASIKNKNVLHEVNEKGEPVKGPLFEKYRKVSGVQVRTTLSHKNFDLKEGD